MTTSDFVVLFTCAIFGAFVVFPHRFYIENLVDALLSPQRYGQMKMLQSLDQAILASADRDELLAALLRQLRDPAYGYQNFALLVKDTNRPVFKVNTAFGLSSAIDGAEIVAESALVEVLMKSKKEVFKGQHQSGTPNFESETVDQQMEELQADICFPLFSRRRNVLFGLIAIGRSRIGYSAFVGRNLFWLKTVIEHSAIVFDNIYHSEYADALVPFVAKPMVETMRQLKDSRAGTRGGKVWASVLMVDIRQFTKMSAKMTPQEVVELLEEYRTAISPIVQDYGGMVDKFIGDAIMVVFGLHNLPSFKAPDMASVDCGLAIMDAIKELNDRRLMFRLKGSITVGVGISSGEVVAGTVSAGDRYPEIVAN